VAPRVSAVVTSYNHARTVRRALESALAQDVPGLEVVVVDDASSDGSREILEAFRADARVRLELHERNQGISPVFNRGLELARGELVAFLGSDDYWYPGHLAGALTLLDAHPEAAMCWGRVAIVDADDRDVTAEAGLFADEFEGDLFEALLLRSNFVPFISVVMRRDLALRVGGFDGALTTLQDLDLWLRLSASHTALFRTERTAAFRWDGRNASRRSVENSLRFRRELAHVLEKTLREMPRELARRGLAGPVRRRLAQTWARLARRQDDPADRARSYRRALHFDPYRPGVLCHYLASRLRAGLGTA
jgi:glycosyltransferase involved in cell wall biosynthesis